MLYFYLIFIRQSITPQVYSVDISNKSEHRITNIGRLMLMKAIHFLI